MSNIFDNVHMLPKGAIVTVKQLSHWIKKNLKKNILLNFFSLVQIDLY